MLNMETVQNRTNVEFVTLKKNNIFYIYVQMYLLYAIFDKDIG